MLVSGISGLAQTSGIIRYTETLKMDFGPGNVPVDLPSEDKVDRKLMFNAEASLDGAVGESKEDVVREYQEEGRTMMIRMNRPEEQYYTDLSKGTILEQKEMMGRKFLIDSRTGETKWKLTGRQKKIAGYNCQEAEGKQGDVSVTAWFTPELPLPYGPLHFGGLPGIILRLELDKGHMVVEANAVELKPVSREDLKQPKEGKRMSRKDFRAMLEERRKEMGGEANGNGNVIIRIRQ